MIKNHFRAAVLEIMGSDIDLSQVFIVMNPAIIKHVFWYYANDDGKLTELQRRERFDYFTAHQALPIYGHWYSVVPNIEIAENDICFVYNDAQRSKDD